MRRIIAFALVLTILVSAVAALAAKPKKRILYLNSYHNGYAWSDTILEGIRTVLDKGAFDIELQIEYMDAKRYPTSTLGNTLSELYRRKFRNTDFDAIIVSDNDAYDFILKQGDALFPGTPVVFCGINFFDHASLAGHQEYTGVLENFDIKDTLEMALRFDPERRRLVVISDDSTTGVAIRRQIEEAMPLFQGRLGFEYWLATDLNELLDRVKKLPGDVMLYFIPIYQNISGTIYSAEQLLEQVARVSDAPLYSNWEFLLGHGTVGGKLISGRRHGQTAARLALRVVSGEKPGDIPVITSPDSEWIFDYDVLQKRHISRDLLPEDSRLINVPKAFYELDKQLFWTIIVSLVLLLIILAFLVRAIIRRRAVERAIINQLSFLELLLDTIPLLICWKDRKQRYLGVNRSFARFFQLDDSGAFLNRTDRELLLDTDFVQKIGELDRKVIDSRSSILKHRVPVRTGMGETQWLEINKVPLRDGGGGVVGTLSTAENVTREVNLERQLLQSQKMEAIGTLAGGLAHDFNNILTSIINSTELAIEDVPEGTLTRRDLERVLKAASRGSRVVKQILTFSRPSQEGFTNTNIAEIVREAVGLLETSVTRNITIRQNIPDGPAIIHADPTQIHQIIMNLCTNSFQAMRESGGLIEVSLESEELTPEKAQLLNVAQGLYRKLTVADNGPGIQQHILDKVFDPFFTTKGKAEGTGLGLAVVHGIVKGHRGAVRLTSEPWKRTAFEIYLPIRRGEETAVPANVEVVTGGRERILFVEDDADQLATTPRLLEKLGYMVTARQDPAGALLLLETDSSAFDVVVTDFDMPQTNGIELANAISRIAPELPVILVSGREIAADAAARVANISSVIMKPYSSRHISEAIRQALS